MSAAPSTLHSSSSNSSSATSSTDAQSSLIVASSFTCNWCDQPAYSMVLHAFPLRGAQLIVEEVGTVTSIRTNENANSASKPSVAIDKHPTQRHCMPLCKHHASQFGDLLLVETSIYTTQLKKDSLKDASVAASSASSSAWKQFLHDDEAGRAFATSGSNMVRNYDPDMDDDEYDDPPHCRVCRLSDEGADGRDLNKLHSIGFGKAVPSTLRLLSESELKQVDYRVYDYWCELHVDDMVRTVRIYNANKPNISMPQWDDPAYVDPNEPSVNNQK